MCQRNIRKSYSEKVRERKSWTVKKKLHSTSAHSTATEPICEHPGLKRSLDPTQTKSPLTHENTRVCSIPMSSWTDLIDLARARRQEQWREQRLQKVKRELNGWNFCGTRNWEERKGEERKGEELTLSLKSNDRYESCLRGSKIWGAQRTDMRSS
jgi:hypothetical protein